MVGFEEVCTLEGMWAPLQARLELREMFERWLSRPHYPRPIFASDEMVDELSLLDLCQYYRLEYLGGAKDVAKTWDESELRIADGGPTFDELARLGWIFFDGGRWIMQSMYRGASSYINYPSLSTKSFLTGLRKARLVAKTNTPPPSTQALAAKIEAQDWLDRRIPSREPEWLAGRLWERLCPKPQFLAGNAMHAETHAVNDAHGSPTVVDAEAEAVDRAFLEWVSWCSALRIGCRWDADWGSTEKRYCREAAHRVLERQTIWGTWDNDAARYADVLENTFAIPPDQLRYGSTPRKVPPRSLVSRVDWLKWPDVEHLMMERLDASTVSFAFGLLCSELEETDIGSSITATATAVLSFAANHPMASQQILFRVRVAPRLLVDMLMHEHTACLAAKLTIEWSQSGSNNDRNVSREAQTKTFAVQDALSLLAYNLNKGTLDPEEYASLITWCYDGNAGGRKVIADSRRTVGQQLFRMVAGKNEELQSMVLQYLVEQAAYEDNIPRARFSGVLDGLNHLSNVPVAGAFPIVALYSKFARDLHLEWTDAFSLPAVQAARLVMIAFAQAAPNRDALLIPFDSVKLLRELTDDETSSLSSSIAENLRGHVRLLSRAVAGWPDNTVPTELCDALQMLVSRSVIQHVEKGRIGALTDRYGSGRFFQREEGSPAKDLAAAWRNLNSTHQEAMLQAFVLSDDPVLLAELCQHLPTAAKPPIQARLRTLGPGEASEYWTWPELQHRIDSLLAAGEYKLAREHMDEVEQELDSAPPQFRLSFFSLELQLLLKEQNWTEVDKSVVPSALDESTRRQAQDQLDFYRATSQMLRPNGNLAAARAVLQRLSAHPNAASAYKENAFAVVIQQLLGPTLHPLAGKDKAAGESLLAEINAAVAGNEKQASSNLLANRALLLLGLQKAKDALDSLTERRREDRSANLERIAVLAKYEMGQRVEAMAILDAVITEFDDNEGLIALKNDLEANVSAPSVALPSVTADTITSIRVALQKLTELQPSQVGDILGPADCGVEGYLVREVSRAVATLQQMSAMLRGRKNVKEEARLEDDLNSAVRKVLEARLAVPKWDVADQSRGGRTANGNPGERDAVIRASGQEISIYEALVCTNLDRTKIKQHFDKLLSYGICEIYFLVIYSYAKTLKPILEYVKQMLEHETPPSLTYRDCKWLRPSDYETSGYIATYSVDHREVSVVFLIADLKTEEQQVAGAAAPTT